MEFPHSSLFSIAVHYQRFVVQVVETGNTRIVNNYVSVSCTGIFCVTDPAWQEHSLAKHMVALQSLRV